MTPLEYDILDELYFPQTPLAVADKLGMGIEQVLEPINGMLKEGLVQPAMEEEMQVKELAEVRLVATKKGLLAHNGIDR